MLRIKMTSKPALVTVSRFQKTACFYDQNKRTRYPNGSRKFYHHGGVIWHLQALIVGAALLVHGFLKALQT